MIASYILYIYIIYIILLFHLGLCFKNQYESRLIVFFIQNGIDQDLPVQSFTTTETTGNFPALQVLFWQLLSATAGP